MTTERAFIALVSETLKITEEHTLMDTKTNLQSSSRLMNRAWKMLEKLIIKEEEEKQNVVIFPVFIRSGVSHDKNKYMKTMSLIYDIGSTSHWTSLFKRYYF
jgi:hypothetical protein